MMKVLIDTCVVLDAIQNRKGFSEFAQSVLLSISAEECEGFITASSATDIYYIHRRSMIKEGVQNASSKARESLSKLLDSLFMLTVDDLTVRQAIASKIEDFEDAVQIEASIKGRVDCIVTRNLKDFEKSPIPVYSPEEFIKMMEKENQRVA